jgi:putative acetyltransferase
MVAVRSADPRHEAIVPIIEAHIAHGDAHYPPESNHHLTVDGFAANQVQLLAAWDGPACVGINALKPLNDADAELKSMHVVAEARGQGVGAALVEALIHQARARGFRRILLETGGRDASSAARRLYERFGFAYRPPFGAYREDPESVFMTRRLD